MLEAELPGRILFLPPLVKMKGHLHVVPIAAGAYVPGFQLVQPVEEMAVGGANPLDGKGLGMIVVVPGSDLPGGQVAHMGQGTHGILSKSDCPYSPNRHSVKGFFAALIGRRISNDGVEIIFLMNLHLFH